MKKIFVLALCLASAAANAAPFELPRGFTAILDCPASPKGPHFMIAAKNHMAYLVAKSSSSETGVRFYKMEITDGDCGYSTFAPKWSELGSLEKHVAYVHIHNNDEDLEDPEQAVITGGSISNEANDYRDCKVVKNNLPMKLVY